jgi:hypothetical protein
MGQQSSRHVSRTRQLTITIFWSVTPHSLIYRYRGFEEHHLLQLEKLQYRNSYHKTKFRIIQGGLPTYATRNGNLASGLSNGLHVYYTGVT